MHYTTLIPAAKLAQQLSDPNWIVLDCRHDLANPDAGRAAYDAGHIPNAQFAHLDLDLSDKKPGPNGEFRGRHPLPARDAFIETLRRWGVNRNSQIIAYDAQGSIFAARLWWMLRWIGHENVAVLDGGLPAWIAQRMQLSTEPASRARGDINAQLSRVTTVSADDIVANLSQPSRIVVDARAPDRFRGQNETLDPVGGRIPGARSRYFRDNLDASGRFKSPEALAREFGAVLGAHDPQEVVNYCGSGVSACHNLLAMEVAGLRGARLYPGSWSEWCADPSRPVESGEPTAVRR